MRTLLLTIHCSLLQIRYYLKLFGSMSKECYVDIGYYIGIGSIEEIVRKRRDKFINRYGVSDNCRCQLIVIQ